MWVDTKPEPKKSMNPGMKIGIAAAAVVVLLLAVVVLPIWCGGDRSGKIDPSQYEYKQPPGHEQAMEEMEKKPH